MGRPRIGLTATTGTLGSDIADAVERVYLAAVVRAGGLPVVLPTLAPELADEALAVVDGLLLTGGDDLDPASYRAARHPMVELVDPARDAWEVALAAAAQGGHPGTARMPVLGICRGLQLLNVAAGGTLVQHLPDRTARDHQRDHEPVADVHEIELAAGSLAARVLGTERLAVNSLHHQAVDVLGAGLVVSGRATDGTIEAIEVPGQPTLAAQWHPEYLVESSAQRALFDWLVTEAARARDGASARDVG